MGAVKTQLRWGCDGNKKDSGMAFLLDKIKSAMDKINIRKNKKGKIKQRENQKGKEGRKQREREREGGDQLGEESNKMASN